MKTEIPMRRLPMLAALLTLAAAAPAAAQVVHVGPAASPIASATVEVTCGVKTQVEPQIKEDIIPTETISPLDIRKVNAVSLTEAVDFKPGISVQTECSICNVRNVVLNNLPGRFTTIMLDGVPIFSSVSGAYGLDMIGVNGVESIEVSRGAGVSLIAPEALAGAVNLVSKHPTQEERILEVQGGDDGYRQANAFWAHPFDGGAITALLASPGYDALTIIVGSSSLAQPELWAGMRLVFDKMSQLGQPKFKHQKRTKKGKC